MARGAQAAGGVKKSPARERGAKSKVTSMRRNSTISRSMGNPDDAAKARFG
jgi:hypothetical protein